jgi:hypothetical protein
LLRALDGLVIQEIGDRVVATNRDAAEVAGIHAAIGKRGRGKTEQESETGCSLDDMHRLCVFTV